MGLPANAVKRLEATVFGQKACTTLFAKVAALMHSIARNHALIDGNKRMVFVACAAMLRLNVTGYDRCRMNERS